MRLKSASWCGEDRPQIDGTRCGPATRPLSNVLHRRALSLRSSVRGRARGDGSGSRAAGGTIARVRLCQRELRGVSGAGDRRRGRSGPFPRLLHHGSRKTGWIRATLLGRSPRRSGGGIHRGRRESRTSRRSACVRGVTRIETASDDYAVVHLKVQRARGDALPVRPAPRRCDSRTFRPASHGSRAARATR